jgi:hypothetical protein
MRLRLDARNLVHLNTPPPAAATLNRPTDRVSTPKARIESCRGYLERDLLLLENSAYEVCEQCHVALHEGIILLDDNVRALVLPGQMSNQGIETLTSSGSVGVRIRVDHHDGERLAGGSRKDDFAARVTLFAKVHALLTREQKLTHRFAHPSDISAGHDDSDQCVSSALRLVDKHVAAHEQAAYG